MNSSKKKAAEAAGAAAAGGLALAAAYRSMSNRKPDEEVLPEYFEYLVSMLGLPGLLETVEDASITNDGLELHLDVLPCDDPSAPALVFVPGTSLYALVYAEFMHKMRVMGFNVVGVDPRGHGRSEGRRGSYTMDELVSDALAAVRYARNRFGRTAISGSSQGGMVAFYAAAADDTLVGTICHNIAVLSEPAATGITRMPRMSRILRVPTIAFSYIVPEMPVPLWTYLDLKAEPTKWGMNAKEFIKYDPLALKSVSLKSLASLATARPVKPIELITVPVMAIQAEFDEMFTVTYTESIYDRLTCDKEMMVLLGRTHLVMTNDVDEIVPEAAAFLNRYM
jgi:alpha-beta hydrolase superfamily lysophospholipase